MRSTGRTGPLKTYRLLLTPLEISRLTQFAIDHPGSNIWLYDTPNGIDSNVAVAEWTYNKGDCSGLKTEISDIDSW